MCDVKHLVHAFGLIFIITYMSKEINSHSSGVGTKAAARLSDAVFVASAALPSVTVGFVLFLIFVL